MFFFRLSRFKSRLSLEFIDRTHFNDSTLDRIVGKNVSGLDFSILPPEVLAASNPRNLYFLHLVTKVFALAQLYGGELFLSSIQPSSTSIVSHPGSSRRSAANSCTSRARLDRPVLRVFSKPAQRVDQFISSTICSGLREGGANRRDKPGTVREIATLRTIAGEEKCEIARYVFAAGSCHREKTIGACWTSPTFMSKDQNLTLHRVP